MRILKWFGIALGGFVVLAVVGVFLLEYQAGRVLETPWVVNVKHIPIPFPLSRQELAELSPPPGTDLDALAMQRAIARGQHYVESRAACSDCHGADFGGSVVVDNPVLGRWVAPNISRGGVTKNYTNEDWVRIIRHGIKPDGHAATMPSDDFAQFSDQEISDIVAYINSRPAVDRHMPPTSIGPMMAMLIVSGERVSAEHIDHTAPRPVYPPAMTTSLDLGEHLTNVCKGCHGAHLGGGAIPGGDPSWPAAANLTFDKTGLAGWSLADFKTALRQGQRPDGSKLSSVMPIQFTGHFTDEEVESIYEYLKTLPVRSLGAR